MVEGLLGVASAEELVAALGPAVERGRAIALIGGADFTEPTRLAAIRNLFQVIAAHCARTGTAVVDGGTDSGVMRVIAEARLDVDGDFPLIGVAPAGAFRRRSRAGASIEPAKDHDVILLVPGEQFGDETDLLFVAADHLGGGAASTILVNGGALALDEAWRRLRAGHVVVTVDGSGRAADELASSLDDDPELRASGRLRTIPLTVDEAALARGLSA